MSWMPTTRGGAVLRSAVPVLVLGAVCSAGAGPTVGAWSSTAVGGDGMERPATLACGERIEALLGGAGPLAMTGKFPARVHGGDGAFTGTVTVANTGNRVSGVTSPEADVFVAQAGKVVSTPLPKDLIARQINLGPGDSQVFSARGGIRQCAAGGSGVGEMLPSGRYAVFALIVITRDDGPAVVATGGPWSLEVT